MMSITAAGDDLAPIKDKVVARLAPQIKLQGFRDGKVPATLAAKNIDQNVLQQEFLDDALNELYAQALRQEKLRPVNQPQVSLKKFVPFTELEIELDLEVIGEIQLPDYIKIKKTKPSILVTSKDIEAVIDSLRQRMAQRIRVERAAKNSDEVIIDFKGIDTESKMPVNGAEGKNYPLTLGSDAFIPGFEENIVGLKASEEKTFTLTFPKDYGIKALANKKVSFSLTVRTVNELAMPKVDDVFASSAGPFQTLEELKQDIKKQLTIERQQDADRTFENELIQEIADKSKVTVPDTLIIEQVQRNEEEEKRNLAYRGQTWQEHLAEEGVTEEQHRERNRQPAEQQVKASIVLSEIAEHEKIDVTPEELEIRLQLLKGQYQDTKMRAELDKPEAVRDIAARLLTEKTIAKLTNYASK